jgi:hypothetical protein
MGMSKGYGSPIQSVRARHPELTVSKCPHGGFFAARFIPVEGHPR